GPLPTARSRRCSRAGHPRGCAPSWRGTRRLAGRCTEIRIAATPGRIGNLSRPARPASIPAMLRTRANAIRLAPPLVRDRTRFRAAERCDALLERRMAHEKPSHGAAATDPERLHLRGQGALLVHRLQALQRGDHLLAAGQPGSASIGAELPATAEP